MLGGIKVMLVERGLGNHLGPFVCYVGKVEMLSVNLLEILHISFELVYGCLLVLNHFY